jgi:hypothetical protein
MSSVTLEKIEEQLLKIGKMIGELKAASVTIFGLPEIEIELKHGEHYAGIELGKNGEPSRHLILLPEEAKGLTWNEAKEWAKKNGGELPTRRQQYLLFANLKEQFKEAWYWSGEEHALDSDYAWYQSFMRGTQDYDEKNTKGRAMAIRSLIIE